jgi:hypothetical protein
VSHVVDVLNICYSLICVREFVEAAGKASMRINEYLHVR